MDDFNFAIEGDVLFRNEITKTDKPNEFTVKKVPVINMGALREIFRLWIQEQPQNIKQINATDDEEDEDATE